MIAQDEKNETKVDTSKREKLVQEREQKQFSTKKELLDRLSKYHSYQGANLTDFFQENEFRLNDQAAENDLISIKEDARAYFQEEACIKELKQSIFIEQGRLHEAVDAAEQILIDKKCGIYQRAGKLVRMVTLADIPTSKKTEIVKENGQSFIKKDGIKRSTGTIVIREVEQNFLTETLTKHGSWIKPDSKSKEGIKKIDCPDKIAKNLLARLEWDLSVLTGIINAPTLRNDGSILDTPGYDKRSGIFFDNSGMEFPKILDNPTHKDALQAKEVLSNIISDFPFEKEASKSVMISAILTGIIRRSLPTAPVHAFSAPKMANGKTLLADIVSIIATGKSCSVLSHANNETEERKRLFALLIEGELIACIDNVEDPFSSPALCAITTQESYKDRMLGETRTQSAPTNTLFLVTGNNLIFVGDISTRVLLCKIDAGIENPEERAAFKIPNLRQHVIENRGKLVMAALTILRAYVVAGKPKQDIKPFGRFEKWDFIRSAIIWIGMADPCLTRKEIENEDPVRINLKNLFISWYSCFGGLPRQTKDVMKYIDGKDHATNQDDEGDNETANKEKKEKLENALIEFASDSRGNISQKIFGQKLSAHKGRIEGGYKLEKVGESGGSAIWKVKKV